MATNSHAKTERAGTAANSVPPVDSFAGDQSLTLSLNRNELVYVLNGLILGASQCVATGNFDGSVGYMRAWIAQAIRGGITTQQALLGDLSPPMARGATA